MWHVTPTSQLTQLTQLTSQAAQSNLPFCLGGPSPSRTPAISQKNMSDLSIHTRLHGQRKFRSSKLPTILKVAGSSCSIDVFTAETFWRVGIVRNAVFFHNFVASKARKGRSEKRELRRIGCPRCRQNWHHACARERFGVDLDKICTTPARESDLKVKMVKSWHVRSTFGSWHRQNLHHACARERFGSQNR